MKNFIIAVLLIISMQSISQEARTERRENPERMSAEQRNQLHLKRMTADLNLNETQQREVAKLIAERESRKAAMIASRKANRETRTRLTADERFKIKNQRLDEEIAMKKRLRDILTPEQYSKWELKNERRKANLKNRANRERQMIKTKYKRK